MVLKGYGLALLIGTQSVFILGSSKIFTKMFRSDLPNPSAGFAPRLVSAGLVLFSQAKNNTSELAALFTIAVCAMWPTVINTAVGVRAIPQD